MPDIIHRKSLLYYWSIRYFLLLIAGLMIVGSITLYFIQENALSAQSQGMKNFVRDVAHAAAANEGIIPGNPSVGRWLNERINAYELDIKPIVFILDLQGKVISQFPPAPPVSATQVQAELQDVMTRNEPDMFTIHSKQDDTTYQAVVFPMTDPALTMGYALYITPKVNALKELLKFKELIVLLCTIVLIGWGIIYLMTNRLIKPIQQAADAAEQIVEGNYNLQFDKTHKEEEIQELMKSFKEMADRLNRLEALRTQLIAGVTHELKTPVTSISGLIQAVKGQVVTGEEADLFLELCLKDSYRLQKMIEDLLDFNSFVDSTVSIDKEWCDLDKLVAENVESWLLSQDQSDIRVVMNVPDRADGWKVQTDPLRIEQIIVNLLNNARDAMASKGTVTVHLIAGIGKSHIQVHDTGKGIPAREHSEIFEPFYRGDDKKTRIRGLGIGLTFSRIIARSLGGDLILTGSIPGSTTFTLTVPSS
ncbi:Adaptive-response sensory-kinase SasA [Paenibacillus plantiphilus]|uniref:histidine kinase n=1 Tax=Paenibacillus plantiphilus TaxID=2905650 RepID=A0ABM9CKU5_9BACL|nr:HAMP domain-containing sensor histidine kinase [Paenibacillus plantiphilus]CAH1216200.1 Adaptive-response sensory-kinase SasA [Paenibacillus plantiphilus]